VTDIFLLSRLKPQAGFTLSINPDFTSAGCSNIKKFQENPCKTEIVKDISFVFFGVILKMIVIMEIRGEENNCYITLSIEYLKFRLLYSSLDKISFYKIHDNEKQFNTILHFFFNR
jgi:hypothetical protein